ncbi:MAG: hypothetical protein OEZ59_01580 [Deltaproteobacteria bacterium]|nr:hypothetical protein [Deltaproteobacteria bacterium]
MDSRIPTNGRIVQTGGTKPMPPPPPAKTEEGASNSISDSISNSNPGICRFLPLKNREKFPIFNPFQRWAEFAAQYHLTAGLSVNLASLDLSRQPLLIIRGFFARQRKKIQPGIKWFPPEYNARDPLRFHAFLPPNGKFSLAAALFPLKFKQ